MNDRLGNHYLSTQRTGSQECSGQTFTSLTRAGVLAQAGQILLTPGPNHPISTLSPCSPTFLFQLFPLWNISFPSFLLIRSKPFKTCCAFPIFLPGFFPPEGKHKPCRSTECTLWVSGPGTSWQALPWDGREGWRPPTVGGPRQTDGLQRLLWRGAGGEQVGRVAGGIYMAQIPHWVPLVSGTSACWMA